MSLRLPIRQPRFALASALVGALSFWLPDVATHLFFRFTFDRSQLWAITLLMPATLLCDYLVVSRLLAKHDFNWVGIAMLIGVWLTGGLFMMLGATVSGGGFASGVPISLVMIASSIIPVVTCMMATYDGSLFALLIVTFGAILIWGIKESGMPLPFQDRFRTHLK